MQQVTPFGVCQALLCSLSQNGTWLATLIKGKEMDMTKQNDIAT